MIGMLEIIKIVVLGVFLLIEGIRDLQKHKVSMITVMIAAILGVIFQFGIIQENGLKIIGGILIGIVLLSLAKITREKIGYGDGWIFVVTGIYLGFHSNMYLLLLSLFLASINYLVSKARIIICRRMSLLWLLCRNLPKRFPRLWRNKI